nr:artificial RNA-ligase [synthetic construct]
MDYKDDDDKGGKHICAICGDVVDTADAKTQYDSCGGCKGIPKRTERKELTYTCRDYKNCESYHKCSDLCLYCRYQLDLAIHHQHHHGGSMGMSGSGTGY